MVVVSSSGRSIVASSATQAAVAVEQCVVAADQPDVPVGRSLVAAPLGLLVRVAVVPVAAAAAGVAVAVLQFARAVVASLVGSRCLGAPRIERLRRLQRHSVRVVAQPLRLDGLAVAAAVAAAPSFWMYLRKCVARSRMSFVAHGDAVRACR